MSNFAQIVDNKVVNVVVAEADFIASLPGTWVQTSYNTRGNVHYGQDGQPDGGVALRANFAGIGDTYDSVNDVFYKTVTIPLYELDTSTYLWKLKPQFANIKNVKLISSTATVPPGNIDTDLVFETVTITNGDRVLLLAVTQPGVYIYNKPGGVLEYEPSTKTATIGGSIHKMYTNGVDGTWKIYP